MPEQVVRLMGEINLLSVVVRLTLAALFGAVLGIDRGRKRRPAGLRTYMLVCLGSALVMLTGQYITLRYAVSDPARLGAQVISGIGFLGAGTIIVTRHNQVIGLTTAAGLWASACFGLAIGIGFYVGALVAGVFIALVVILLHRFDDMVISRSKVMELYGEFRTIRDMSCFIRGVRGQGLSLADIQPIRGREGEESVAAVFTVKSPVRREHGELVELFSAMEGVVYLEEI